MSPKGDPEGQRTVVSNRRARHDYEILERYETGIVLTGAEGIKTAQQALDYGGTAGVAYDHCYHQACDTFANNSDTGLDQMSDAVAHTVLLFSKRNFSQDPL